MDVLKNVFGYEDFKNHVQRNAVIALTQGSRDVCITMPSGYDRNLCFQLPALMNKGKAVIVFSPDVFLAKKEITFLKSKGIGACLLHELLTVDQWFKIVKNLKSTPPKWTLMYCTPKTIRMLFFLKIVLHLKKRRLLSYIVFEEAHSVSEWEYEYPNYYQKLKYLEKMFRGVRRVAVAPPVTYKVLKDIIKILSLKNPKICKMFVQHSNIYYDTCDIDGLHQPVDDLCTFLMQTLDCTNGPIQKTDKDSAIIYCRKANEAEELKNKLNGCGIPTLTFHYKTDPRSRDVIESKWISGEGCVMITTYDYEFIHNRANRVVVYWTVPESIRKYYRESIRAHKENTRIHSRIYFSTKDCTAIKFAIDSSERMNSNDHVKNRLNELKELVTYFSSITKKDCTAIKLAIEASKRMNSNNHVKSRLNELKELVSYFSPTMCRHVYIYKYFGHTVPTCKTNCDVCIMQSIERAPISESVKYLENRENTQCNIRGLKEDLKDGEKGIAKNNERILKNTLKSEPLVCEAEWIKTKKTECREVEIAQSSAMLKTLQNNSPKSELTWTSVGDNKNSENKNAQNNVMLKIREITNGDTRNILNNIPSISQISYSGANDNYNNEKVDALINTKIGIDRETNRDGKATLKAKSLTFEDMCQDASKGNNKENPSTSKTNVTTTKTLSRKHCNRESVQNVFQQKVIKVTKDESHSTFSNECAITPKLLVNRYNLNEDAISLIPIISIKAESKTPSQIDQRDTHIIHGQMQTQKSKQIISLDNAHLKNYDGSNEKKVKSVSSNNYSAVTNSVSTNERHKNSNKRQICTNVHEDELKPIKRRKIAVDCESSNNTKLILHERILAQHNEDNETEFGLSDSTSPEVLMKKFNLNKSEITLKRRKTVVQTKR